MPFRPVGCGSLLFACGFLWISGDAAAQHIHTVPQTEVPAEPIAAYEDAHAPARHDDLPPMQPSSYKATEPAAAPLAGKSSFPSLTPAQPGDHEPKSTASPDLSRLRGPALTMASSLAVVLGLFAGLVWLTRRFGSKAGGGGELPRDVVQSLGSTSVGPRTRVTLLKCGAKVIVVAQTATEIKPLSEITDPEQVRQLVALCQGDSRAAFSQTIKSIEREPLAAGFVG